MKDMPLESVAASCFPLTEAIVTYVTIRRTHDEVNRYVSRKLGKWKLSVPKYGIIVNLYDRKSLTLSELSQRIFSGNSNLTTLVDRMERDGIVERLDSATDRRVKKIQLTEKGSEMAPRIISEYRSFLHKMMTDCLSPGEQKLLTELLVRVKDSIASQTAMPDRKTPS
jgi:DNA-binding MarR family transcriptional regulator